MPTTNVTPVEIKPIASHLWGRIGLWLLDGALLGLFMICACGFATLLESPDSPVHQQIELAWVRRVLMGLAMAITALLVIYSPMGKLTGPLLNPAMVLTFLRLRRLNLLDTVGLITCQFLLGTLGVGVCYLLLRPGVEQVHYAATQPGAWGMWAAWLAEFVIAMVLVITVTTINHIRPLTRYSGCFVALLILLFIITVAPISGMSLNPARSFASAWFAKVWAAYWIYLTAPVLGMLSGAVLAQRLLHAPQICSKLNHSHHCVFKCNCLSKGCP